MRRRGVLLVIPFLAMACAGPIKAPDLRADLLRAHGYVGREDDSASVRYIESRPDLRAALLRPEVVSLSRVLAADYGTPFDPKDGPELVSWAADADVRANLLAPASREFARALAQAGVLDGDSLRILGGPLWRPAAGIVAALAGQPGMRGMLTELGVSLDYRLRVRHASDLRDLLGEKALRESLRSLGVTVGWRRIARRTGLRFVPRDARTIARLSLRSEAPGIIDRLITEFRVKTSVEGLVVLDGVLEDGRAKDLFLRNHVVVLTHLRDRPGVSPSLKMLRGTLVLAEVPRALQALDVLAGKGWRPRLDEITETEAVAILARDDALRTRVAETPVPPDAGRGAVPVSARALCDAADGKVPPLAPWLDPADLACLEMVLDPGWSHDALVKAVLAMRGKRELVRRPRTAYDETGRSLTWMNRADLLRIRTIQAGLEDPDLVRRLVTWAWRDRADTRTEHGGWITLDGARHAIWDLDAAGRAVGDGFYRVSTGRRPERVLATFHFHALGGAKVAGPSSNRTASDLAAARRTGLDGVVVTLLGEAGDRIDVDFHDTRGRVLDLGVYP
jgi:hypothetical protein